MVADSEGERAFPLVCPWLGARDAVHRGGGTGTCRADAARASDTCLIFSCCPDEKQKFLSLAFNTLSKSPKLVDQHPTLRTNYIILSFKKKLF